MSKTRKKAPPWVLKEDPDAEVRAMKILKVAAALDLSDSEATVAHYPGHGLSMALKRAADWPLALDTAAFNVARERVFAAMDIKPADGLLRTWAQAKSVDARRVLLQRAAL